MEEDNPGINTENDSYLNVLLYADELAIIQENERYAIIAARNEETRKILWPKYMSCSKTEVMSSVRRWI